MDTTYVGTKLRRLLFPFAPGHQWERREVGGKPLPPKHDQNAMDLYIPTMALVTYVLACGVAKARTKEYSTEFMGDLLG